MNKWLLIVLVVGGMVALILLSPSMAGAHECRGWIAHSNHPGIPASSPEGDHSHNKPQVTEYQSKFGFWHIHCDDTLAPTPVPYAPVVYPTSTPTPTATMTPIPTATSTPVPTPTPTYTPTPTPSPLPTPSPTVTPVITPTPETCIPGRVKELVDSVILWSEFNWELFKYARRNDHYSYDGCTMTYLYSEKGGERYIL